MTAVATCVNHAAREAIGICVECRERVCAECSTKVDGINYCVSCLQRMARAKARTTGDQLAPSAGVSMASLAGWMVCLVVATWLLVQASLPG